MTNHHLVILKKPYLDAILDGRKTLESRFMRTRREPFGQISAGDKLFLKVSSGPVCAVATVKKVMEWDNLSKKTIKGICRDYNERILGTEQYWTERAGCKYGVLVWIEKVRRIEAVRIDKKDWRAWVVLTAERDFGLLG